jgi:hypothetical protein
MTHTSFSALVVSALTFAGLLTVAPSVSAQTSLGSVTISRKVMADGKPLSAGTYQVRLTDQAPTPAVGQSPEAARYVEFVRGGKVAGRELATIVSAADIGSIAKGARPAPGTAKVEVLKGEDFIRVWINRRGMNYIINMPPA